MIQAIGIPVILYVGFRMVEVLLDVQRGWILRACAAIVLLVAGSCFIGLMAGGSQ